MDDDIFAADSTTDSAHEQFNKICSSLQYNITEIVDEFKSTEESGDLSYDIDDYDDYQIVELDSLSTPSSTVNQAEMQDIVMNSLVKSQILQNELQNTDKTNGQNKVILNSSTKKKYKRKPAQKLRASSVKASPNDNVSTSTSTTKVPGSGRFRKSKARQRGEEYEYCSEISYAGALPMYNHACKRPLMQSNETYNTNTRHFDKDAEHRTYSPKIHQPVIINNFVFLVAATPVNMPWGGQYSPVVFQTKQKPSPSNFQKNSAIPYLKPRPPRPRHGYYTPGVPIQNAEGLNPKQFYRIMKRREARERLYQCGMLPRGNKRLQYLHKSRHLHAITRLRGFGGRFLTAEQINEMRNI